LRRRAPLRTGRARFRASGPSKPTWRAGVDAAEADETGFSRVRPAWIHTTSTVLRMLASPVSHWCGFCGPPRGDQGPLGDRAASILLAVEPEGGAVDRQARFAPSRGPVVGERRVVGGRRVLGDLVADDVGPGEAEVTAAVAAAEHPPASRTVPGHPRASEHDCRSRSVRAEAPASRRHKRERHPSWRKRWALSSDGCELMSFTRVTRVTLRHRARCCEPRGSRAGRLVTRMPRSSNSPHAQNNSQMLTPAVCSERARVVSDRSLCRQG
jgi:hypothetical protein